MCTPLIQEVILAKLQCMGSAYALECLYYFFGKVSFCSASMAFILHCNTERVFCPNRLLAVFFHISLSAYTISEHITREITTVNAVHSSVQSSQF